jgi:four helix bundle protein
MRIEKFEEMKVWQEARILCKEIYYLTTKDGFKKDYGLKDQIQRASVSIITNIAEGFERDSNKEFIKFLNYSKGSAGEVRALLYIAFDLNYIDEEEFKQNYEKSISVIKQLSNFIKYLRNSSTKS